MSVAVQTQASEPEPQDQWGRRLKAERDALLELIAIFTHDLSNPLQSITVLCELGIDESPNDSEERMRNEQCLEAAARMRTLVHGLASITRRSDGPPRVRTVVERVSALLARRFDRNRVTLTRETAAVDDVPTPDGIEYALVNLVLGTIAMASDNNRSAHELVIVGDLLGDHRARLGVRMSQEGQSRELSPDSLHGGRVAAFLATVPGACYTIEAGSCYLEFDVHNES